ncbi:L-ribulose-5-phosphate 3-epimerase [Vagococcus coleopterorum]|uniref:L-ribulose-5-phosphate 3-epimerase n=1 Tax=Vagococcus coleopterorum TaxID=2714946 RepID=A0A6G8APB6_9ENTE|nr:L-ribulose-5-phosphate 3-epimerase [Vagococcus coleopterorum]QIL46820.1 L-ribulose-5-phosphate 3-epimerase [Vagococcus coleopterorum]
MTQIGIYEKALPKDISWDERLALVSELGFNFIEMSVDETDERLSRLNWSQSECCELVGLMQKHQVKIHSICFSGQRRFPMGSHVKDVEIKSMELMWQAIDLASDLGIRVIQLAGYDVYYEDKDIFTRNQFIKNLEKSVAYAAEKGITLAIEIMDDPFINSITKFLKIKEQIPSPFLQVYPDLGNLSAWSENDIAYELEQGTNSIVAIHLKDTYAVTGECQGQFRDVVFGEGCVDFKGCLETLHRLNYPGPFLIEMWSENSDDFRSEINKAKEYLYPILREAGYDV